MQIVIDETLNGKRLDVAVTEAVPRLSRTFVQKLCDSDKILVNGKPTRAGQKVRTGSTVEIDYDIAELDIIPKLDLEILYEDDNCIVINKPAGVLTHAQGAAEVEGTVATFLRDKVQGIEGERAGVVHRLDRATTGVIIGAKNQEALSFLQKQFAERKTKKTYIAIVEGHLTPHEAIIDMPIGRNPKAPATFRVSVNGKPSSTHYKVIQENDTYSMLELKPETGRTHQLRVHLQQVGHPIVGDPLYGSGQYGDRLLLHAKSLEITLPGGERKIFEAPLPKDFEEHLK